MFSLFDLFHWITLTFCLLTQIFNIPIGVDKRDHKGNEIFMDHDFKPILQKVGFGCPLYHRQSDLIWFRGDVYKEDIVTAGLFLVAGSHKVCTTINCEIFIKLKFVSVC